MSRRAWMYPEKEWRTLGEVRWDVEWHTMRPGADEEEWEPDTDIITHHRAFATQAEAQTEARRLAAEDADYFGVVEVQKQVVDWFVEEDRVGEWSDVGDPEQFES